jgi:hypothetical protein
MRTSHQNMSMSDCAGLILSYGSKQAVPSGFQQTQYDMNRSR